MTWLVIIQLTMTYMKQQKRQTWKSIKRNHILNPIEKLALRNLVENNAQTINETANAIGKQYKSTFRAFTSLKKRGLIKKTTLKEHRGRKYPRYWVTELGIFKARIDGADPMLLLQKAQDNYPENKDLLTILKTAEIIGTKAFNIAYSALLSKGKLEPSDIALIMTIPMQESNPDKIIQLFTMLEEYPEYYRRVKENLEQFGINLQQILKTFRRENHP